MSYAIVYQRLTAWTTELDHEKALVVIRYNKFPLHLTWFLAGERKRRENR